jgi:outer membrane protein TolC
VLLQVSQFYFEVMRQEALLQIQVQAVEVSRAQLKLNKQLQAAGTGTYFNVLQAETQLAIDEQALLQQQVALRQAAIQLGAALNANLSVNLLSTENRVQKLRVFDPNLNINDLIGIAIANRPELKQYEYLRLAARRNIQVAAAPLYPQFSFFGSVAGNGATLTNTSTLSNPSFSTVPIGNPIPGIQAKNAFGVPSPVQLAGVVFNPPAVVRRQVRKSYIIGFHVDWNYPNLGVHDLANVQANRVIARQATLQANQQLINVLSQVRQSYLTSLTAERVIDVASAQVISSAEQLRLARVRLANGVGINLDVIQAQQAWVQALANKANAIIDFNIAQAQVLHDVGVISVETMTSGRLLRK